MRRLLLIGIGAGDPALLTLQAVEALRQVDVLFTLDKGDVATDLQLIRDQIRQDHCRPDHRVVVVEDPPRPRGVEAYAASVKAWRQARTDRLGAAITTALPDGGVGGVLVWGDPALYDGSILIADALQADGMDLAVTVVPGISSPQVLAAAHGVPLNRAGQSILVTTGRRLAEEGMPATVDNIVVMLDATGVFADLDQDLEICWGAFLGTPDQVLVRGRLAEVCDEVTRARAAARERKGWLFDTYLLRRP